METDFLLQQAEAFIEKSISADISKVIEFKEPFSAGESLELTGSVIFHKPVDMSGHTLRVYGSVHCKGSINNANLLAYQSVRVDGEIKDCNVFAQENISLHHALNSSIWSYGDITIDTESVGSNYMAAGSILGPAATVRGGRLACNGNITLDHALSPGDHTRLSIVLGDRKIIKAKITAMEARVQTLENDLVQVKECIDIFARKIVEKRLIGVHIPQFEAVKQQRIDIEKDIARLKAERDQLMQSTMTIKKAPGTVIIRSRCSNGVFIEIEGSRYETSQSMQSIMCSTNGHEVIVEPYYAISNTEVVS